MPPRETTCARHHRVADVEAEVGRLIRAAPASATSEAKLRTCFVRKQRPPSRDSLHVQALLKELRSIIEPVLVAVRRDPRRASPDVQVAFGHCACAHCECT